MKKPDIEPGAEHPIVIRPLGKHIIVRYSSYIIADSDRALLLDEKGHPAVIYVPRTDVRMEYFDRTQKLTHCPYKGDAVHFTLHAGQARAENAAWSYEEPTTAVPQIKDHLAFYPKVAHMEVQA